MDTIEIYLVNVNVNVYQAIFAKWIVGIYSSSSKYKHCRFATYSYKEH